MKYDQKITFRIRKVEVHFSSFANVHTGNCGVVKWNFTFPSFANVHTRNCKVLVSIYGFLTITLRIELQSHPLVLLLTTIRQSNNIL